jgi:hypothetical protein
MVSELVAWPAGKGFHDHRRVVIRARPPETSEALGCNVAAGAKVSAVISDREIWAAASVMVKRYKADAMLEAAKRANQLLGEGDMAGAETWHRILSAIERLQAKAPADGEKVH